MWQASGGHCYVAVCFHFPKGNQISGLTNCAGPIVTVCTDNGLSIPPRSCVHIMHSHSM